MCQKKGEKYYMIMIMIICMSIPLRIQNWIEEVFDDNFRIELVVILSKLSITMCYFLFNFFFCVAQKGENGYGSNLLKEDKWKF